jgi:steroid delta-isomerase-like uncharacterized protein
MSIEENKAIVRKLFEYLGEKEEMKRPAQAPSAADLEKNIRFMYAQNYAPDYVEHGPQSDMTVEEMIQWMIALISAFPDLAYKFEDHMIAEGDKVVVRYSARGTHLGRYQDVPPSGKKIEISGIYIIRVANGKIAEGWYASSFFSFKDIREQLRLFLLKKE